MAIIWNMGEGAIAAGLGGPILLGLFLVGMLAFGTYLALKDDGGCEPVEECLNCADFVPIGSNGLEVQPCGDPEPPPI